MVIKLFPFAWNAKYHNISGWTLR